MTSRKLLIFCAQKRSKTVFQNAYNSHKKTFTDVTTDIEDKGQEIKTKTDAGVDLLEELKGTIN